MDAVITLSDGKVRNVRETPNKIEKVMNKCEENQILGKGRPNLPASLKRKRKVSKVFEPLVVLQRPSLNSNSSDELGRQLDTNDMVDHLVNTLGLIGVSPSFPRRPRPSRISLQHNSDVKINEQRNEYKDE